MKRILSLIIMISIAFHGCKQKTTEKDDFYKHHKKRPDSPVLKSRKFFMTVSDSSSPKGKEYLNQVEEYDAKGQKIKLTQFSADSGKIQYVTTYKYDNEGNAIETHTQSPVDGSESIEKNTFNRDHRIIKTDWSHNDGSSGTHEFQFDALGHMTRWDWKEKGQIVTWLYPVVYDKKDRLVESFTKKIQTTKDTIEQDHQKYTYDSITGLESGKIIFLNNIPLEVIESHYDSAHNKIMEIDRENDSTGKMEAKTTLFFYTEYGEVLSSKVFKYGKVLSSSRNTYDKFGHLMELILKEGNTMKKSRYEYQYY